MNVTLHNMIERRNNALHASNETLFCASQCQVDKINELRVPRLYIDR